MTIVAAIAITIVLVLKENAQEGLSDLAVNDGTALLKRALESGDPAFYEDAELAFRKAASVSVVDYYPAFLIQTNRRIQSGDWSDAPPGQVVVLDEISQRQFDRAREEAAALGAPGSKPRIFYERLINDLSR